MEINEQTTVTVKLNYDEYSHLRMIMIKLTNSGRASILTSADREFARRFVNKCDGETHNED